MKNTENILFKYHPKFRKEFEKIINKRKCPSLKEDFELFKDVLIDDFSSYGKLPRRYHKISGLASYVNEPAFIVKDFRCKGIGKGKRSGFRLTFVFYDYKCILFTEIYYKNKKEVEDKERINKLFKK